MKIKFFITTIIIIFVCSILQSKIARAEEAPAGIEMSPTMVNETAKAKELFNYDIKIKNNNAFSVNLYAMVGDILEKEGYREYKGPGEADRKVSVSSWLLFKRSAIDLAPGQEITVPLTIDIATDALPGKRYAQIVLANGSNWDDAKLKMQTSNFPKLLLNFDIQDESVEKAQVKSFSPIKNLFIRYPIELNFVINNNGNRVVSPVGSIYIYDRRGREVSKIPANSDNKSIEPGKEVAYKVFWENGSGMGQFKAKLDLEYGEKTRRDLSDLTLFWVFPKKWLIIIGSCLVLLVTLLTILIFKKTYKQESVGTVMKPVQDKKSGVIDLKRRN